MKWQWRIVVGAVACAAVLLVLDRCFPPDLSRYRAVSIEVTDNHGDVLSVFPAKGGVWRLRASPAEVDEKFLHLLLLAEDRNFYRHDGVDPGALARAAWQFASEGHIVSGASTLSMQTARLLEPHRRGVIGKLHDMARAVQLERRYSKDEILSIYLTLCPYGGNLEGVRAASLAWFGHEPSRLSAGEAALLAAIPPAPSRRRADLHPAAALAAMDRLRARLAANGTPVAFDAAPRLSGRHALPHETWLFAWHLAHKAPPGTRIVSTIDARMQRALSDLVARETAPLDRQVGVAMILVENDSRKILASIGGRGDDFPGGAIDLTRARRSPGSALKPFIYGMAFDDLILHPASLIDDSPGPISGYAPHNFDSKYHGSVSAAQALAQSYNVPAVKVLQQVGAVRFIDRMRIGGGTLTLPPGRPGLAVALGGVGINLFDLTQGYAAIADHGMAAPLRAVESAPLIRTRFLGELAAYYLPQILQRSPPPPGMAYAELTGARSIAFKTGTSFGFRDAWAAGFSGHYTLAVWMGCVEGTPRPGAYGRNSAAPLMFHAFALLPPEEEILRSRPRWAIDTARAEDLPPHLRRLAGQSEVAAPPHLVWPPADSVIDLVASERGAYQPVHLRADRGKPPFRWFVNGVALPRNLTSNQGAEWVPDGPGFAHVVLVDANDQAVKSIFRLVEAE